MLYAWSSYNYELQTSHGKDQNIWWNSKIRIANVPFLWEPNYKKGLLWTSDIFQDGKPIDLDTAWTQFGLTKMQLNSLFTAIPEDIRKSCKKGILSQRTVYDEVMLEKALSKKVYSKLTANNSWSKKLAKRWKKDFPVNRTSIVKALKLTYITTNIPKFGSFQYRLLNRALIFNTHLKRWGISSNEYCNQCNLIIPETMEHCLFSYESAQKLWKRLTVWMNTFNNTPVKLTYKNVILNQVCDNVKNVENFVTLVCKQYICNRGL